MHEIMSYLVPFIRLMYIFNEISRANHNNNETYSASTHEMRTILNGIESAVF